MWSIFRYSTTFLLLLNVVLFTKASIEITPLILNFKGVIANDSMVVAYADFGSLLISTDNEQSWRQKRVFTGGEIITVIQQKSTLIACNDRGGIASSNDKGENWNIQKQLDDSILAFIPFNEGYLVRCKNSVLTLDSTFSVIQTFALESPEIRKIPLAYSSFQPNYRKSITGYNDHCIIEID